MQQMTFQAPWERGEFFRARWRNLRFGWRDVLYLVIFGVFAWRSRDYLFFAIFAIVFYPLLKLFWETTLVWNQMRPFQGKVITTFSDQGIASIMESESIAEDWSTYPGSRETSEFYLLRSASRRPQIAVRKRLFDTQQDEAWFRTLLRAHTKATLRSRPDLDSTDPVIEPD